MKNIMSIYSKKTAMLVLVMALLVSVAGVYNTASAKVPYSTPWGRFYREPEQSNQFGRCWYGSYNNNTVFDIYLECYYSDGSSTSIKYKYTPTNSNNAKSVIVSNSYVTRPYSSSTYTRDVKGKFIKAELYGAGHGISVQKTYKSNS